MQVDGLVCWLLIPGVTGVAVTPVFHRNVLQALSTLPSRGLDVLLVWVAVVATATLVYSRLRRRPPARALVLTAVAVVLPLLTMAAFLVATFAGNVGG